MSFRKGEPEKGRIDMKPKGYDFGKSPIEKAKEIKELKPVKSPEQVKIDVGFFNKIIHHITKFFTAAYSAVKVTYSIVNVIPEVRKVLIVIAIILVLAIILANI